MPKNNIMNLSEKTLEKCINHLVKNCNVTEEQAYKIANDVYCILDKEISKTYN